MFVGNNSSSKVPTALPKHRVLVSRISEESHTVEVYYLTTFAGKLNPVTFHKNHPMKRLMYIPVAPLIHDNYLSITSTPPVIRGWCNFVQPAVIRYEDETPSRELLRHCPESVGINPPLWHGRITIDTWHMKYLRAMSTGWGNTIHLKSPVQDWIVKARHLKEKYSAKVEVKPEGGAVDDPETKDWSDEPEWTGITCVSSMTFLMLFCHTESSQLRGGLGRESEDECERFDLQEITNSINSSEFATPSRTVVTQLPTPVTIGRNTRPLLEREGISRLSTIQPPTPPYLTRHERSGVSTVVADHECDEEREAEVDEVQYPEWGGIISVSLSIGIPWIILY